MTYMLLLKRFVRDESGTTAIEYALIASGIAMAIVLVVQQIGTDLKTPFIKVKDGLQ